MKSNNKFLSVIKWLSLAFAICFSMLSCGESLLPSKKTEDQVDGLIDDNFINTADYVALKDFNVEIKKPNSNNIYYIGQKINYDVTYSPSNASYKTLKYEINNEDLIGFDEKTHEIECLKSGVVEIKFWVLKEEKVGIKTLEFEIKKLNFNKFDVVDNKGDVVNNKDIIFKNIDEKPRVYKIDTDSIIARDLLLQISVGDNKIASVTKEKDNIKITPVSPGRTTATLKIDDLIIKLYISTIELNLSNVKLTSNGILNISKGRDYKFNTLYFNCDDVRAVDHERLEVEFENDSYFELADYRSGIIIGRNQFFLNIWYKQDKYKEVAALPEGTLIEEKIKVKYVYPGGTEVYLNQDRNGKKHEYFEIKAVTIPKISDEQYSLLPSEVNFGYLINQKGELYHQDYFQDLITKTSFDFHYIKNYDYYYPKFEVIEGNKSDLNLSKSSPQRLIISLNENVIPSNKYVIRYYFSAFDKTKYKDITVNFEKITKLPENQRMHVDFRNLYGELDRLPNGKIPDNYTYSVSLFSGQLAHYEFVDEYRNILPAFKSTGIIIDEDSVNKENYIILKGFENKSLTEEPVAHKNSYYSNNYGYEILLKNRKDIIKEQLTLRFTSPIYDFFGVERVWSEFVVNVDDSPVEMEYKINNKTVQFVKSNEGSSIYEYPEELNIGDKIKLTFQGKLNKFYDFEGKEEEMSDYKYLESTNYDGNLIPNYKNRYEVATRLPSQFGSLFPIEYASSDPDVADFANAQLFMKYPGESVLTFYNGFNYGDHYEFEFKIKVKVKGEKSPINVHETKLVNFEELKYSKNDLANGNIRVGSSIKIDKSMFNKNLFDENVDIQVSNPSILYYNKENNSLKAIRTGKVSIFVRLKKFNHVVEIFDLNITNSTAPFKLLKSDFIELNEENDKQSLVTYVDKEYNLKIKPIEETSSKFIKIEEINENPILEISDSGVIKTDVGGNTKIKVTYGNKEIGEQEFSEIYDLKVIDNSKHYNGVIYFTRKFVGHFGLNAAIAICASTFLILLFYNKKKLNYLIAPISLTYCGLMACLSELIQKFVPSRTCALNDMRINFQGSLFGIILTLLIYGIVILSIFIAHKIKEKKINK